MASKFRAKSSTFHYALISRDSRGEASSLARELRCNGICMSRALIRTRTLLTRCEETRKARKIIGVLVRDGWLGGRPREWMDGREDAEKLGD